MTITIFTEVINKMKLKAIFLSGIITASILSANVYADETTAKTTNTETTSTTSAVSVTQAQTEPTESNTAVVHGSSGSIPIDSETAKSPEFFNEIMNYVGEDNAANLNENLKNNALTINSTTIDYSDKSMFTITTRSGDVFYLIINNSDGSCLFLNSVDTADLTSMLNSSNGQNQFNESAIEEMQKNEKETKPFAENSNTDTVSSETTYTDVTEKNEGKKSIWSNILLIVGAIVLAGGIAFIYSHIKKRRRNSNSSYDEEMYNEYNEASDSSDEEIVEYQEDDLK